MKLLFAGCLLFASIIATAQNKVSTMTGSGDTLVDTTPDDVSLQVKYSYKSVSVQAVVTKVSGTVAGTGLLQGSLDGVNYLNLNTDTLTLADQTTNTKVWIIDDSPYLYYKVAFVGVGTMSAKIYGYVLPNEQSAIGVLTNLKSSYGFTSDTVTNSGTNTVILRVNNWYETTTIQPVITKISGTAGGTVTLQGSDDGTNYVTVNTSYLLGGSATLSVLNQTTNSKLFVINGSPYAYYRLSYTGTGTMVCTLKGYVYVSK